MKERRGGISRRKPSFSSPESFFPVATKFLLSQNFAYPRGGRLAYIASICAFALIVD